jgi:hypothetical protein
MVLTGLKKRTPFMKLKHLLGLIICTALCLLSVDEGLSQEVNGSLIGHVFYGLMNISNADLVAVGDRT